MVDTTETQAQRQTALSSSKREAFAVGAFGFFSTANLRDIFAVDLRTLALFRMALAASLLYSLYVIVPDIDAFLTDDGVLPRRELMHAGNWHQYSLYFFSGSYLYASVLVAVHILATLCLFFGYRTRLATFVCWLLYVSLVDRTITILQGGDVLLPLLLFWGMFLPLDKVFSVDAALRSENHRDDVPYFSVATIGLLLQVVYVYVFGALLKVGDEWTPDGTAVYFAMHLDTFATPLALWLRQYDFVSYPLTYFVYWLEMLTPLLLFFPDRGRRVRAGGLVLLVGMHLGFRVFLHIGHFWLVSIASLSSFVTHHFWRWFSRVYYHADAALITLYYDTDCAFCLKTCQLLREFCLPRSVDIIPAQSVPDIGAVLERETSWVVLGANGRQYLHWDALVFVVSQSVLLKPLAWVLMLYGKLGLGRLTYNLIGRNRHLLGRFSARFLAPVPAFPRMGWFTGTLLSFVIMISLLWNVRAEVGNRNMPSFIPDIAWDTAQVLKFAQYWSMFAPMPATTDYRQFIIGHTVDGRDIDLALYEKGVTVVGKTDDFESYRWRKYVNRIAEYELKDRDYHFRFYTRFLCRDWNAQHSGADKLVRLQVKLSRNITLPHYERQRTLLDYGTWTCN